ncbi:hypothetical protein J7T55_007042 [Diaporthe amygdali]|uniref:uncharacterized protein n=1 Tax=Phomopsis amygdali TaxID=1214568 RepID=UPI0022FDFCF5|nr:uncharacterized protein J7T55_007042 [Diaporthe amygdali]KAJ0104116.1 hypothetical protein J7T55_007042 [Diaporthe amygdali]
MPQITPAPAGKRRGSARFVDGDNLFSGIPSRRGMEEVITQPLPPLPEHRSASDPCTSPEYWHLGVARSYHKDERYWAAAMGLTGLSRAH